MLGAIIGDMVGSLYEFHPLKKKEFNIYNHRMRMTDDSLLTIAVAETLIDHYPFKFDEESLNSIKQDLIKNFALTWFKNRDAGFGGMFYRWCDRAIKGYKPEPYNSYGNGSAMRISPVAWATDDLEEMKRLVDIVTKITHNHPEGIKGARVLATCIFLARGDGDKPDLWEYTRSQYPELSSYEYEELVKNYRFNETCQGSVPEAIYCFLYSENFEDCLRTAVSIGGDTDTVADMACAIAEAYYQDIDDELVGHVYGKLTPEMREIVDEFRKKYGGS